MRLGRGSHDGPSLRPSRRAHNCLEQSNGFKVVAIKCTRTFGAYSTYKKRTESFNSVLKSLLQIN